MTTNKWFNRLIISYITKSSILVILSFLLSGVAIHKSIRAEEVIENLSKEREVPREKYQYRVFRWDKKTRKIFKVKWSIEFQAALNYANRQGYYAAVMDRKNIKIFKEYFTSQHKQFIFDFFESKPGEVCREM